MKKVENQPIEMGEVERLRADRVIFERCQKLMPELEPSFRAQATVGTRDQIVVRVQLSLAGHPKETRSVSYARPRTWWDYVKFGIRRKFPWFVQYDFFMPDMETIYIDHDFYDKMCPHLGKDPSQTQCLEWMFYK